MLFGAGLCHNSVSKPLELPYFIRSNFHQNKANILTDQGNFDATANVRTKPDFDFKIAANKPPTC